MKMTNKILLIALMGTVLVGACKKKGCTDETATNYSSEAKKDDQSCTYTPTITLTGAATVNVDLNGAYTDAGATATNHDGSSVTVTDNASSVNTASAGTYTVTYTATNDYGTVTTTRTVNVVIPQGLYTSTTWAIDTGCSSTDFPIAAPTIAAGNTSSDLVFTGLLTGYGGNADATINGSTITIPSQIIDLTVAVIDYSGTGTMNNTGTEFSITYTYTNGITGGSGACTTVYTAQ